MSNKGTVYSITVLSSLSFFIHGLNLLSYGAVQGDVIAELNFSLTESGLLVAIYFIPYAVMQIPGGHLADRLGGEKTIAIFMSITCLAAFGFSQINSFAEALAFRFIIGFGTAPLLPSAIRTLSHRLVERKLDKANGILAAGWGISFVVVLNLVPVVSTNFGWRLSLLIISLITFAVASYAWATTRYIKPLSRHVNYSKITKKGQLLTRKLCFVILINTAAIAISVGAVAWAPLQLQSLFNISPIDSGRIISLMGVMCIVAAILGGIAPKVMERKNIFLVSSAVVFLAVALLINPVNLIVTTGVLMVLGFSSTFYVASLFSMVTDATPLGKIRPGFVFGVLNTISNVAAFFPPFIMGLALDLTQSFAYGFAVLLVTAGIGLLGAIMLRASSTRDSSHS